ncbi:MAG: PDZ domain-containing protein [Saprospiraceae bacterium]|nr:PDZ domain-containing protein [Saprospiraceae bacterium]
MQIFTWQRLGLATLMLLFVSISLQAQEKISPVTVTQRTTAQDGTKKVVKKRFDDQQALQKYLKEINGQSGNVQVEVHSSAHQIGDVEIINGENAMIYIRRNADRNTVEGHERQEWQEKLQQKLTEVRKMDFGNFDFKEFKSDGDRPMLGIYLDESSREQGVRVSSTVAGGGARAAGIQGGDVVTGINGVKVNNRTDLRNELNKYKPGQTVDVTYVRDGLTSTTESTLYRSRSSWDRDPCEVFIGVSLGGNGPQGKGIHVSNIIGDTPAEKYGIKAGDVITSFDGVTVNSYGELLRERNKHEAGDWFKVQVERDGGFTEITAQFKSCDEKIEEPIVEEEIAEEVVEVLPEVKEELPEQPQLMIDNTLELNDYNAFPNPTYGQFNLRFQADPVPTRVRVIDVNGKVVYNQVINQFDGIYNEQINLSAKATPGTLFVQILQGQKVVSKKIVLVPRA